MSLRWYGADVLARVSTEVSRRLDIACIMLTNDIVKSFGSAPPMPKGLKGVSTETWRHAFRSKPGEPPHVDAGHLRRSIGFDSPNVLTRRVGSTMKPGDEYNPGGGDHSYAWYLEMGTSRMAPRPYLLAAVRRNRARIRALLVGRG